MTNQEIQQIIENCIAELNITAEQKKQELKIQCMQKIEKSESFLTLLQNEQQRLQHQLIEAKQSIEQLEQPLIFTDILDEFKQSLTEENVDLNALSEATQHRLQAQMHQQMNELKVSLLSRQQDLADTLEQSQATLSRTPKFWLKLNEKIQARFGDHIQKVKIKLADQLENCAGKLKA